MTVKRKIWTLPAVSILVSGAVIGVSTVSATDAAHAIDRTVSLGYPLLDLTKDLTLDVGAVADGLRDAVSEADRRGSRR